MTKGGIVEQKCTLISVSVKNFQYRGSPESLECLDGILSVAC
jgi:hypothetical protein